MKKQKAMSQMKGQDKTPEKQLNEVEIGNLSEKDFRIMIVKMTQDLGGKNGGNVRKRVQNNDREDDPGSRGKEWRQRLRRCRKRLPKT